MVDIQFFGRKGGHARKLEAATLGAIDRSQAIIEFALDGTITCANQNFLQAMGYEAGEVIGRNHSMFVAEEDRGASYQAFWQRLRSGQFDAGEYKRLGKDGREVWIQASYNPVLGEDGKPVKIVKFATDVTATKLERADLQGQIDAINKSQAVIEFTVTGEILHANENFCRALGYRLDEIKGRHHRMFVPADEANSLAYSQFWRDLAQGQF